MKETIHIRSQILTIRLNQEEREKLNRLCSKAQCNTLSEYARAVLLKEPVTIKYRNKSADDLLEEMLLLKKELHAIGHNYNQVVHKLHILDHDEQIKSWALLNESGKKLFMKKMGEICEKLNQIHEQWSQK